MWRDMVFNLRVWRAWVKFNMVVLTSGLIVMFLGILDVWPQYLVPAGITMFAAGLSMELILEFALYDLFGGEQ